MGGIGTERRNEGKKEREEKGKRREGRGGKGRREERKWKGQKDPLIMIGSTQLL